MRKRLMLSATVVAVGIWAGGCGGGSGDSAATAHSPATAQIAPKTTKAQAKVKRAAQEQAACVWRPGAQAPDIEGGLEAFSRDPDKGAQDLRDLADQLEDAARPAMRAQIASAARALRALADSPWDTQALDEAIASMDELSSEVGERC